MKIHIALILLMSLPTAVHAQSARVRLTERAATPVAYTIAQHARDAATRIGRASASRPIARADEIVLPVDERVNLLEAEVKELRRQLSYVDSGATTQIIHQGERSVRKVPSKGIFFGTTALTTLAWMVPAIRQGSGYGGMIGAGVGSGMLASSLMIMGEKIEEPAVTMTGVYVGLASVIGALVITAAQ